MFIKKKSNLKNKGTYLAIALVIVLSSVSYAQYSVGIKSGININQFTMPGSTIGINAGAYGVYKALPFLSARVELLYTQEGGGLRDYYLTSSWGTNLSNFGSVYYVNYINPYVYMHSVQVPIMAELSLPEFIDADVQPVLFLGGCYSYMFQANEMHTKRYAFTDGTFSNIPYLREDARADFKVNQFSVLGGMGLKFKGEKRDFYFDVRYRQGISQLNQIQHSFKEKDGRLYSSTLSINLSVSILKF